MQGQGCAVTDACWWRRPKPPNGLAHFTITLPRELKDRMHAQKANGNGLNWSQVARDAFEVTLAQRMKK
jgi:hypothetical protein